MNGPAKAVGSRQEAAALIDAAGTGEADWAAADHVGPLPVHTVVVADACTDTTAALAARAVGVTHALAFLGSASGIWLAMTDADSTVPAHWLTRQIAWARRGHDAVLGTIRLAPASQGACRYARSEHDAAYYRTRPAAEAGTAWEHPTSTARTWVCSPTPTATSEASHRSPPVRTMTS
ncbi:glycosyltransferase family A protein [Streptomyces rubiginosohelvolus]|uniref:glycosyltransferase family A protein n=1 Tax=Streptomyces rubiginosohelvolus TaxID=67362 RepID=UPI0033BE5BFE